MKIKVSIIIVYYKGLKELFGCLDSIKKGKNKTSFEIILVDNSRKGIEKRLKSKYKRIGYIKTSENLGYGKGNNLGAASALGKYLFILNPDTKLKLKVIDRLTKFLDENKKAGIVAPNLVDSEGEIYELQGSQTLTPLRAVFTFTFIEKLFPNNIIRRKYWLRDKSKEKLRQVETVPGSAFMIRSKVFGELEGIDENFFLYFEENDLCKRVIDKGYGIYMDPGAEVMHFWKPDEGGRKRKEIFRRSRFYYFKKHFGLIKAIIAEGFLRLDKYKMLFFIIFTVGAALRFYSSIHQPSFSGEIGDNLLEIKNYYEKGQIPLVGPPTSHPWLDFGPLFYWIYGPVLILSGFDPISHSYFGSFVSSTVIFFNYIFIRKIVGEKTAVLSSAIIALSPYYVGWGHAGRFFTLVPLLIYPYVFYLHRHLKENKNGLLIPGILMGLMLNLHFTPLLLIPPTLVLSYLFRKRYFISNAVKYTLGVLAMNIPLLIYDSKNGFDMLSKFALWIPYRIAGFLGLVPKNNLTETTAANNLGSFFEYVTRMFTINSILLDMAVFIVFVAGLLWILGVVLRKTRKYSFWVVVISFLVFGYLGIFVHGNPPEHYYMPIAFIPPLIFSYFVVRLRKRLVKNLLYVLLIAVFSVNLVSFKNIYTLRGITPYERRIKVASYIVKDAKGQPFVLKRVGVNDQYEGNFAQDYQYLMWWMGNEPVVVGDETVRGGVYPTISYTIYEGEDNRPKNFVYKTGGIYITRKNDKD
jgi:N-acetylglucosaminyl-diphospho-decaprenol L-rhamnosyltransferase